jgi:hypothetical protein
MATSMLYTLSASSLSSTRSLVYQIDLKLHSYLLSSILLRRYNDSLATSTLSSSSDLIMRKDLAATLLQHARVLVSRLKQRLRTLMSRKAFKRLQASPLCSARALYASYQDYQKLSLMSSLSQQCNCSTPRRLNHLDGRPLMRLSSILSP